MLHKSKSIVFQFVWAFWWECKVELDLSNYATKTNMKEATGIDTFTLATKTDLASLKT